LTDWGNQEANNFAVPPIPDLGLLQMALNGNHYNSSMRTARNGDDPMTHLRKVLDQARNDLSESLQRSKRALAEADAALKIGSK
jgi:hypothetical protein